MEPLWGECGAERGPHPVVPEVVLLCQLLEQREDVEVVEDVDALHVTEAVVQDPGQLWEGTRLICYKKIK